MTCPLRWVQRHWSGDQFQYGHTQRADVHNLKRLQLRQFFNAATNLNGIYKFLRRWMQVCAVYYRNISSETACYVTLDRRYFRPVILLLTRPWNAAKSIAIATLFDLRNVLLVLKWGRAYISRRDCFRGKYGFKFNNDRSNFGLFRRGDCEEMRFPQFLLPWKRKMKDDYECANSRSID